MGFRVKICSCAVAMLILVHGRWRVRILVSLLRIPEYFLVLEAAGCSSADLHLLVWYLVLTTRQLVCLLSPPSFFLFSPSCTVEHAVAEEIHFVNAHYFGLNSPFICVFICAVFWFILQSSHLRCWLWRSSLDER